MGVLCFSFIFQNFQEESESGSEFLTFLILTRLTRIHSLAWTVNALPVFKLPTKHVYASHICVFIIHSNKHMITYIHIQMELKHGTRASLRVERPGQSFTLLSRYIKSLGWGLHRTHPASHSHTDKRPGEHVPRNLIMPRPRGIASRYKKMQMKWQSVGYLETDSDK